MKLLLIVVIPGLASERKVTTAVLSFHVCPDLRRLPNRCCCFTIAVVAIGEVVKVDPSQLWRIVTAKTSPYRPRNYFCAQYDHPLLLGTFGRRSFGFLVLSLIRHDGNVFCCYFYAGCDCSRSFYSPLFDQPDHWCFALYCPKPLYSSLLSQSYTSLIVVNLIFSFAARISMAAYYLVAGVMLAYVFQ